MQKVMVFLEKYVQWVALGIGVLWIGLMAYMFWASPTAKVVLDGPGGNNKIYPPGELDDEMANQPGPAKNLNEAITSTTAPPGIAKASAGPTTKSSFVRDYQLALAGPKGEFIAAIIPGNRGAGTGLAGPDKATVATVKAKMPEIDGELVLVPMTGKDAMGNTINGVSERSLVQIPDPSTLVDPLKAEADPAAAAVAAPAAGAAGAAAAGAPLPPVETEVSWVDVSYKLEMKLLEKAFTDAAIPPGATSSFLAVKVIRQTQVGTDWGQEVEVPPLANRIVPTLPAAGDLLNDRIYLVWAQKAAADIIHPPFYVVTGGTPWRSIAMAPPAPDPSAAPVASADQAFDPANPPKDRPLTLDEKAKVYQHNQEVKREAAKAKAAEQKSKLPPPRAPGAAPAPGVRPGYAPAPAEDEKIATRAPILLAQAAPASGTGRPAAPMAERPFARRPGVTPTPVPGTPVGPLVPGAVNQGPDVPEAAFNPTTAKDTEIFFHDDTVEPGKTYRYQIRVYLKNPLFDTRGVAANQKDADVFALELKSPWTGPVAVASKYFFFLSQLSVLNNKATIKVDYFFWSKGVWQVKPLALQPGDAIGDTDWTVADVRKDARGDTHDRVLFVNAQGTVVARTLATDKIDPEYKRLLDQARRGAAAPGAASAGPGEPLFTR